ncbi:MAG: GntR family transcriptional regulator [Clostridiales bacterium]|nr:GntR family transcriptional regulator [Clostridiales bacterium]
MPIKYKQIAGELREEIHMLVYPPGSFLPTEKVLAEKYHASRETIRHALSMLMDEGLILRRQGSGSLVLEKAEEIEQPKNIAIITTYISNYIFPSILREAEAVFSANNCNVMLYATSNRVSDERRILQKILAEPKLDGVLVEGTKTALPNPNLDLYRKLENKNIPLVFFNGEYRELSGVTSILDDNFGGGYMLVEYLTKKGHKKIAGMFKSDDMQGHGRYAGYAAALQDQGLEVEDQHLFWYSTETKQLMEHSENFFAESVIPRLQGSTAVVCYNDEAASYLVRYLVKNGVRIPEQLAVVSFDNSVYSDLSPCRISSLSHGDENVGRLAALALVAKLRGEKAESRLVSWILEEKESS